VTTDTQKGKFHEGETGQMFLGEELVRGSLPELLTEGSICTTGNDVHKLESLINSQKGEES